MYEDYKIYGPYDRPDGRQHVILIKDNERKTVSYPKYLMEVKLGRYLLDNETVHHKDKNPLNNEWDNLEVKDRVEHTREDAKKLLPETFICPTCGKSITLKGKKLSHYKRNFRYRKRKMTGPFCNRSCTGKYGRKVQMGE